MDWQGTLKVLAPTVATALLGPLGGAAVSAIGGILGIDKPTQEAIGKAIASGQMTPEQVANLKALEMQYQNDEAERNFKYADLAFQDRDSARKREAEIKDNTPKIIAYIFIAGFFIVIGIEFYIAINKIAIDPLSAKTLDMLFGVLLTVVIGSKEYYLGTSAHNQRAQDTIADIAKAP